MFRIFAAVMILIQCLPAVCSYAGESSKETGSEAINLNNPPRIIAHGGGEIDGIEHYYHQYEETRRLGFKNMIFTLYSMGWMEYDELAEFIDNHDLFAVTVGVGYKYSDVAYKLAKNDVTVYMHPVNDYEQALALMGKRIHGVYSSTLAPDEFETEEARKRINNWVILKEEIYAACI